MQKQMLIYYCYCNDYTNDINSRMIIRKSRLILNKIKCSDCSFKKTKTLQTNLQRKIQIINTNLLCKL